MPYLISFVLWFASIITNFFAQFVGKKLIVFAVSLSIFLALLAGFLFATANLINTLLQNFSLPASVLSAMALVIPSNFVPVMAIYYAAKATRFAYDVASMKLSLLNNAN